MGSTSTFVAAALSFSALCLTACEVKLGGAAHATSGASGGTSGVGVGTTGAPGGAMTASMGGTGTGGVMANTTSPLLPARIRRLTNAEFDASVNSLLGVSSTFGQSFTPDTRQDNFSRNDAQRVDPVFITQLDDAAQQLAAQVRPNIQNLAPCADKTAGATACARTFLTSFATRAYRRPATDAEVTALLTVYTAGADGAAYEDGIQTAIQAVLESPGFLYVTELGDTPLAANVTLDPYEIASSLSYLVTGAPPDDTLLAAAKAGDLSNADKRQTQLERLLATDPAGVQVTRLIEEWLGIDAITQTAKTYPDFAGLRDSMKKEADDFSSEVMWKSGASVSDLLSANWTIADDSLARMYLNINDPNGTVPRTNNHVMLDSVPRRGILDQGAFLSVYAHASETGPVLRGVAVLRRLVCFNLPDPTTLNINVVPPLPDPTKTVRDRFTAHVSDPVCASCHTNIDSIGFTFEDLNAMGKRPTDANGNPIDDNGHLIDSATTVATGTDIDGNFANSSELAQALGMSSDVRACFARHLFRYAATRSDASVQGAESAFMSTAYMLPAASLGKIKDMLTAFVRSDAFVTRRASE
jgi:hypothetical protein